MKYLLGLLLLVFSMLVVGTLFHFISRQNSIVIDLDPISSSHSQQPSATELEARMSFLAVGDIMLARGVAARMGQSNNPLLPFTHLGELLNSTDFNFGNLESPISGSDSVKGRGLIFNTSSKHLDGLVSYKFKVLNLANNHALDQGLKGLENTTNVLSDKGISYLGVGENKEEAWRPTVVTINGISVGFVGASYASSATDSLIASLAINRQKHCSTNLLTPSG